MSQAEIRPLILNLYRAARETPPTDFQDVALDLVRSVVDFEAAWWGSGIVKECPNNVPDVTVFTSKFFDLDQNILQEYVEVSSQDTAANKFLEGGSGAYRLVSSIDFAGRDKLGLRSLQRKYKQENMLIAGEIAPATGYCRWISMFRPSANAIYSDMETSLAAILVPHVMEALAISCALGLSTRPLGDRRGSHCRGIADSGGFIHYLEAPLRLWLVDEFGSSAAARLPVLVLERLRDFARYEGRDFVLLGSWKDGLVKLNARPRLRTDDLSKRELEVATHIARGRDFRDISKHLNVAPATVRTHIRNIYQKLSISNQAQLIAQLKQLR